MRTQLRAQDDATPSVVTARLLVWSVVKSEVRGQRTSKNQARAKTSWRDSSKLSLRSLAVLPDPSFHDYSVLVGDQLTESADMMRLGGEHAKNRHSRQNGKLNEAKRPVMERTCASINRLCACSDTAAFAWQSRDGQITKLGSASLRAQRTGAEMSSPIGVFRRSTRGKLVCGGRNRELNAP